MPVSVIRASPSVRLQLGRAGSPAQTFGVVTYHFLLGNYPTPMGDNWPVLEYRYPRTKICRIFSLVLYPELPRITPSSME